MVDIAALSWLDISVATDGGDEVTRHSRKRAPTPESALLHLAELLAF
jgi:hypothetical protein